MYVDSSLCERTLDGTNVRLGQRGSRDNLYRQMGQASGRSRPETMLKKYYLQISRRCPRRSRPSLRP
jgi:hypothetical protein